jgi:translation initiation factor IF-3
MAFWVKYLDTLVNIYYCVCKIEGWGQYKYDCIKKPHEAYSQGKETWHTHKQLHYKTVRKNVIVTL